MKMPLLIINYGTHLPTSIVDHDQHCMVEGRTSKNFTLHKPEIDVLHHIIRIR